MSYVIKAALSNPSCPDHGQITVTFPIQNREYDQLIEALGTLEIGDATKQDCQVDTLDSHYTVLKRLEEAAVRLDELDYLAKRLDSFCEGEDAQFQGMAAALKLTRKS